MESPLDRNLFRVRFKFLSTQSYQNSNRLVIRLSVRRQELPRLNKVFGRVAQDAQSGSMMGIGSKMDRQVRSALPPGPIGGAQVPDISNSRSPGTMASTRGAVGSVDLAVNSLLDSPIGSLAPCIYSELSQISARQPLSQRVSRKRYPMGACS